MKILFKPAACILLFLTAVSLTSWVKPLTKTGRVPVSKKGGSKIQVAILLDVSNSMDGLIEQAKAQLWNMAGTMGKASCDGVAPGVEIALYEYGRSTNEVKNGYLKQISPFSRDLDQLSKNLFALTTNGGDEYCGNAIYTSLKELAWDTSSSNYKVIFIAGNEDFLQGDVPYTKACNEAKKKGVIVNTIYCGERMQGIKEHWNLSAECGNGSFTNINQDARAPEIPTPYDSVIFSLNEKLNGTYISYGYAGGTGYAKQAEVDQLNQKMSRSAGLKRVAVKGNAALYKNSSWDLVDAYADDNKAIDKLDLKTLPDNLKNKSREEIKAVVAQKNKERGYIQKEIARTSNKREVYIAAEKAKNAGKKNNATLESEVEKIIKAQAKMYNMKIQ